MYKKYTINEGLISNTINSMIQDQAGYIWLCTDKGLCKYNGFTFEYIDLKKYGIDDLEMIYCFEQKSSKKIYFITSNYNYISYSNNKFQKEYIKDTVTQIYKSNEYVFDNYGELWVIHKNSIECLDNKRSYYLDNNKILAENYLTFNKDKLYFSNYIYSIKKDSLALIDSLPKVFIGMKYFNFNNSLYFQPKKNDLSVYTINKIKHLSLFNIDYITNCKIDFDNNIWITGYGKGALKLKNDNGFEPFFEDEHILNVFIDRDQGVWLMTQSNGIIYLPNTPFSIVKKDQVIYFSKEINSKLYFGNNISQLLIKDSTIYKNINLTIYGYHRNAFVRDVIEYNNNIYVISDNELSLLKNNTLLSLDKKAIKIIAKYDNKLIYTTSKLTYQYENDSVKIIFDFPCNAICPRINNKLMYSNGNGVYEYDGYKSTLFNKFQNIIQIVENNSYIFFISKDNGFFMQNKSTNKVTHINSLNNHIQSNFCNKLYIENDSIIWLCNNLGANKLEYKNNSIKVLKSYTTETGLSSNIINDIILHNNNYYFSTANGINIIKKSNQDIEFNNVFTVLLIDSVNTYVTKYKNPIQIRLSTIYFNINRSILYKYVINGDTFSSTDPNINISNLDPGEYELKVWASNSSNKISDNIIKIPVIIQPLFYQTVLFKFIIFFLLLLIISFIIYVFYKRIKLNTRIAELQTLSLQSQMNPHFIFNAMNSLNSFIYSNNKNDANIFLSKISSLIRKSLDYSTINEISLEEEIVVLKNYLEIEKMRFRDKLEYQISIDKNIILEEIFVPPFFTQIMAENAIIHGISKIDSVGYINIEFTLDKNKLLYTVKDNGLGIISNTNKIHQSKGLKILNQRIQIFNNNTDNNIHIEDILLQDKIIGALVTVTLNIKK